MLQSTQSQDNAYADRDLVFPKLTEEMVDRSLSYGAIEHYPAGQTIYARGIRGVDFLIVLRGNVLITGSADGGTESVVTIHEPREFTGELDLFSFREALVSARAATDVDVLRICRDRFREYVTSETDISDIIMRAVIQRRLGLIQHMQAGVVILGSGHAASTLRLQNFLSRNGYPFRLVDLDNDVDGGGLVTAFNLAPTDMPVIVSGSELYRNPEIPTLADVLGIAEKLDQDKVFDVAVVGAGPAGLAAAVYAASEGLSTMIIEGNAPGGQAGTSSRIENYLGFPSGISGLELAARAQTQAQKFGARLAVSRNVIGLDCCGTTFQLALEGGLHVKARSVVVATGARYRRLMLGNYQRFEMEGVHYSATAIEARLCTGQEVVVVGGGNSAGQAAVYLAGFARHVHILIRGAELSASMSEYLVQRIAASRHISLHTRSEITELEGERHLQKVTWQHIQDGRFQTHAVANIFVMIGATPCTEWLGDCVALDRKGFVLTGHGAEEGVPSYRTSTPGIFAVGDVRSGSVKRVASGVGEGSVVVADIHRYLKQAAGA